jgi:hypothetical protein
MVFGGNQGVGVVEVACCLEDERVLFYLVFVRQEEIFVDVPRFGYSILYDCLIRRIYQSERYFRAFGRPAQCRIIIGKARYRPYLADLTLIAGHC